MEKYQPPRHEVTKAHSCCGALCLCVFVLIAIHLWPAHAYTVLYERQSRYHYIRVIESGNVRTMTFRRKGFDRNQSSMDMSDPLRPCLPYYPLMFSGYLFVPEPRRILVVGLGAGVLSRWSAHYFPEATVESIELDPDVVDVAKKFFGFEETERQRVFTRDARVQIKVFQAQPEKYDIIMLDAFRGGYVPFHLTTKEFFEECRNILSPEGAFVVNLKPGWVIYQYQRRTLASVFPEQYPFGGASGDEVVVALPPVAQASRLHRAKEDLLAAARRLQEERKFSFDLAEVVFQFNSGPGFPAKGLVFTDGHVPANILRQQMENPLGEYRPPQPPLARLAAWLRAYRLPVILSALVLIALAGVSWRRRRSSSCGGSRG
ncbi:MAG: fused MFS/spermidine synthase [bacterium]|nr:fused MFS/spermidine synthase [bacterium]